MPFDTLTTALANDITLWNGAEFYGPPHANSLHLLARFFAAHPSAAASVCLSLKGSSDLSKGLHMDGSRTNVHRSISECLRVLDGRKKIDIFAPGRVDPNVPLEETISAIAEYVRDGKVGGIGLSEVDADTIRRAHAVHPIAAVEVELSLQTPEILTNGVARTCAELGIPIMAYSPLGRGLLANRITKPGDMDQDDIRHHLPRFAPGALEANARLGQEARKVAERKGCTAAQVALAWVRQWSGRDGAAEIVPIPGATTGERVQENAQAVVLTEDEWNELEDIRKGAEVVGARYPGGH
ncbi:MAG: hypothetical protein LQ348_005393 [Seirophora lacunosa]|nr:MAG: hypothetical protein LQ348_005393 [Seirophora lacunosa]